MYSSKEFKLASWPNTLTINNARIQFITSRLIRFEWCDNGDFEDRQTLAVVNRDAGFVNVEKHVNGKEFQLKTDHLSVDYKDNCQPFSKSNLSVRFRLNGQDVIWNPELEDDDNLGATIRTLDGINGNKKRIEKDIETPHGLDGTIAFFEDVDLGKGFISRSGWSVIDDTNSVAIDWVNGQKWVVSRKDCNKQDFYLFAYGHDYKLALADAAKVFGAQPIPPRYTLGYWWSRYWAYSDEEIEELVRGFDQMNVPLDVMVIDMDWHLEGWTGYTWDRRYFPDPDEHLAWLQKHGLKVTLNLHPADGVGKHEEQFADMAHAMGVEPEKTERVEFDITDPVYMKNYFEILHHPEEKRGVDFWWMDWQQGESSKMSGLDTLPWINQLHWEDMEERDDRNNKRPLIFSRFGGYGAGRYCIGFSGDTFSNWKSLAFQPYFTSTASNVLYGYWSHDIGGHMPGEIEPELYTRWMQYGMYSPILRTHTSKNMDAERRVWEYPAPYSDIMIETIRKRYELVPYIYCENRKAFDTGISLCRPMYYDYPEEEMAYNVGDQYMFGEDMLVAPIVSPINKHNDMADVDIWLPEGEWFDTARGVIEVGGQKIIRSYLIDEIPVFVRSGTIIPGQQPTKRLNDKCYKDLVVSIYPGVKGDYDLYEDDGLSTDYIKNKYAKIAISHTSAGDSKVICLQKSEGTFQGYEDERSLEIRLEGSVPPKSVHVAGENYDYVYRLDEVDKGWSYKGKTATVVIKIDKINLSDGIEVKVDYKKESINSTLANGAKGLFARLAKANYYNKILTSGRILHPKERLGQELAHAAYRISRNPETFEQEMKHVLSQLDELCDVLDEMGHSSSVKGWPNNERINLAQISINILKDYIDIKA